MVPSDDSPIWDWLRQWEQARRQGRDVLAEELCRERPELLDDLREAIASLRATDWMNKVAAGPAFSDDAATNLPHVLGDYLVLGKLGAGGMGVVYRAVHRKMDRVVALKVLPPWFAGSSQSVQRFQAEVKAAARLIHPHVVTAFDAGQAGDTHWLAMELVEGTDLARLVQDHGPLPVQQALDYVEQAAWGLEYAHRQGVIHRDIKPGNLVVSKEGVVKVLDLGLSRLTPATTARCQEAEPVAGTVDFMAPEQGQDRSGGDHRVDVYSLGCTFFYLLTGKPIYPGDTVLARLAAHREAPIPSLGEARPDVPAALDALFKRMLSKHPQDRFQSMAEVIDAVKAVRPAGGAGRWRGLLAGCILASLIVAGLAAWSGWRSAPKGPATQAMTASTEERRFDSQADDIRAVTVSPDGHSVLTGCFNTNMVRLWDVQTGKLVRSFPGHTKKVHGVAFSPDGKFAASGGGDDDRSVRVWRVETGELVRAIEGHTGGVWSVAFDPEGKHVFSAGDDKTIRLWAVETGEEVRRFTGHVGGVFKIALSKDGRHLLSGGADNRVYWWDVATGESVFEFRGHATAVWAVAVSPDGRLGLSADQAGIIRLLDLVNGKEIDKWLATTESVFALVFHPGGKLALSGGGGGWRRRHDSSPVKLPDREVYAQAADNSISLWSVEDGRLLHNFNGHADSVWGLDFGPSGDWFVSAGRDRTLRLWRLP